MRIIVCIDGVGPINDKFTNHGVRFLFCACAVVSFVFKELFYSGNKVNIQPHLGIVYISSRQHANAIKCDFSRLLKW